MLQGHAINMSRSKIDYSQHCDLSRRRRLPASCASCIARSSAEIPRNEGVRVFIDLEGTGSCHLSMSSAAFARLKHIPISGPLHLQEKINMRWRGALQGAQQPQSG